MSEILKLSNNITLGKDILIRSASSVGGYVRTQRGGPTLFTIEADMPLLNTAQHCIVQEELQSIDEGISFITVAMPEKAYLTLFKGNIVAATGEIIGISPASRGSSVVLTGVEPTAGAIVNQAGQTFTEFNTQYMVDNPGATQSQVEDAFNMSGPLTVDGTPGSKVFAGDYIQFVNPLNSHTKVYQIKQTNISDGFGNLYITLNQGVVQDLNPITPAVGQTSEYSVAAGTQTSNLTLTDSNGGTTNINIPVASTPQQVASILDGQTNLSATLETAVDEVTIAGFTGAHAVLNGEYLATTNVPAFTVNFDPNKVDNTIVPGSTVYQNGIYYIWNRFDVAAGEGGWHISSVDTNGVWAFLSVGSPQSASVENSASWIAVNAGVEAPPGPTEASATTASSVESTEDAVISVTFDPSLENATLTLANGNLTFTFVETSQAFTDVIQGDTLRLGSDVRFKMQLTSRNNVNAIPQSENSNLYQYDTFNFRETL